MEKVGVRQVSRRIVKPGMGVRQGQEPGVGKCVTQTKQVKDQQPKFQRLLVPETGQKW